ncbi:MAG: hypothetical protein JXL67_14110 [Calditrichaeota bacterium]|nr:hypothetical protein [Calditrichota bacterium]
MIIFNKYLLVFIFLSVGYFHPWATSSDINSLSPMTSTNDMLLKLRGISVRKSDEFKVTIEKIDESKLKISIDYVSSYLPQNKQEGKIELTITNDRLSDVRLSDSQNVRLVYNLLVYLKNTLAFRENSDVWNNIRTLIAIATGDDFFVSKEEQMASHPEILPSLLAQLGENEKSTVLTFKQKPSSNELSAVMSDLYFQLWEEFFNTMDEKEARDLKNALFYTVKKPYDFPPEMLLTYLFREYYAGLKRWTEERNGDNRFLPGYIDSITKHSKWPELDINSSKALLNWFCEKFYKQSDSKREFFQLLEDISTADNMMLISRQPEQRYTFDLNSQNRRLNALLIATAESDGWVIEQHEVPGPDHIILRITMERSRSDETEKSV